ncbi:MAG: hypothetical protein ACREQN_16200 [Candidatus Binataceae bacterium]
MKSRFPQAREEKRRALLGAVEEVRDVLAAGTGEAEKLRTLPPASVAALRDSFLLTLKLPAELGGAEADLVTQFDVIEAVSYIEASAGWCLFIGAAAGGMAGAFLPDGAVAQIFSGERMPTFVGSLMRGSAVAVEGGYRLSGRWSYGSGIHHAEWIAVPAVIARNGGGPFEIRSCVFPAKQAVIHDNWHVMGLRGTGSCDYSVADLFVPEDFTYDRTWTSRRGGPLYRLAFPGFVTLETAAFAIGLGRRALDEIVALARAKSRGYGKQMSLAGRAVFQRAVAEGDLRLRAARTLNIDMLERTWTLLCEGQPVEPRLQAELRAGGALAIDAALEVATSAFRYGAGTAIRADHVLQRCLRDLHVAGTHLIVSDSSYENYGQFLLGVSGADPMA